MKKLFKGLSVLMCVVLLLSTPSTAFAASTDSDDDEKREELENRKNDQDRLTQLELRIAEKEREVSQIKEQLAAAEEDVEDQYASMKQRIKFMYERGNQTYVAMILGAENFSEMINKAEYIEELSNYDRDMLEQYQNTKEAIVVLKEQLEAEEEVQLELDI